MALSAGTRLGPYEVLSALGAGAMGEEELFYIAADDRLTAVPIRFSTDGETAEPGQPISLFGTNVGSVAAPNTNRQQYAVSPDGQSFVLNSTLDTAGASPITVILNWKPPR